MSRAAVQEVVEAQRRAQAGVLHPERHARRRARVRLVEDDAAVSVERQEAAGRPAWRISSTLFAHTASDKTLEPLGQFATPEAFEKFPPISAGEQVLSVLQKINLAKPDEPDTGGMGS